MTSVENYFDRETRRLSFLEEREQRSLKEKDERVPLISVSNTSLFFACTIRGCIKYVDLAHVGHVLFVSGPVYTASDPELLPFTRHRIQNCWRLYGIRSRTVGVYTGSDPFGFYELLAALQ